MTDGAEFMPSTIAPEVSNLRRALDAGVHIVSSLVVIAINRDACEAVKTALRPSEAT